MDFEAIVMDAVCRRRDKLPRVHGGAEVLEESRGVEVVPVGHDGLVAVRLASRLGSKG